MKSTKPSKNAHTANTKYGMGDNYGTGVKQKLGKIVKNMGVKPISNKKLKNPPKSLG